MSKKNLQLTVNERIKLLKNNSKKSTEDFAEFIKIPLGTINGVIGTRKSSPSYVLLSSIIKAFPNLNPRWLMVGDVNMWLNEDEGGLMSDNEKSGLETEMEIVKGRLAQLEKDNAQFRKEIGEDLQAIYEAFKKMDIQGTIAEILENRELE